MVGSQVFQEADSLQLESPLEDVFKRLNELVRFTPENLVHGIDILLVALLIFWILRLIRNTRAWRIVGGVAIFVILLFLSDFFHLQTLHWLLDKATALGPVALVILLLPELRQALEGFAKLGLWPSRISSGSSQISIRAVEDIVASTAEMAASRVGAIIIVERDHPLDAIVENGVPLDASISAALLTSIFSKGSPLHDGAAVLRGNKVAAGACRLPLSDNEQLSKKYHMRHRAALGVAEASDCIAVVVSEERGEITVARNGDILNITSPDHLRESLLTELGLAERPVRSYRKKKVVAKEGEPNAEN